MGIVLKLVSRDELSELRDERLHRQHTARMREVADEIQALQVQLFTAQVEHAILVKREYEAGVARYTYGSFQDRVEQRLQIALRDMRAKFELQARRDFDAEFNTLMKKLEI